MRSFAVMALVVGVAAFGCADDPAGPVGDPAAARLADAEQGGRLLTADMTGVAEAPGPGDPDGSGTARITLNQGQGTVCWELEVSSITLPAAAAHIHIAPVGVPGGVVVTLSAPGATGSASGCTSAAADLIKAIRQDPAAYYVNVHTSDFPAGAVRGQLGR